MLDISAFDKLMSYSQVTLGFVMRGGLRRRLSAGEQHDQIGSGTHNRLLDIPADVGIILSKIQPRFRPFSLVV